MEAANKEWSAAYNSMNGKAFPALYTKDAILMPPGVQPINGSEAIGQFWTDLIKAGNRKNFAIEIASIQRDGKYAYQTGRWTIDQVKDNGEVTKVGGVPSVFSKNSRTASGWPRSTFTIFINLALVEVRTASILSPTALSSTSLAWTTSRSPKRPTGQPWRAGQRPGSHCDRARASSTRIDSCKNKKARRKDRAFWGSSGVRQPYRPPAIRPL
jgi:ketosteroid isomerase-like protein